jgi:hypothetical protein
MLEASFTMSAERDSGRSGCWGIVVVELEGSLVGAAFSVAVSLPSAASCSARVRERERVRLMSSLIPLEAVLLAAVYSLAASP